LDATERILPRAADLWVQASLDQRQRFQQTSRGLPTVARSEGGEAHLRGFAAMVGNLRRRS
jgi:hypothetical protein